MAVDMNKYFINPYNFARYPKLSKIDSSVMGSDKKTGVISCALKVVTPLAIPDAAAKIADYSGDSGHNAYPFFSIGGTPVIPGSELRGLIRNVYETITDSCYSVINKDILSVRSSRRGTPGLLYYDQVNKKWLLKKADKEVAHTEAAKKVLDKKYPNAVKRDWELGVQLKNKKNATQLINHSVFIPKYNEEVDSAKLQMAVDELNTILDLYYEYSDRDETKKKNYFDKARPSRDGKPTPVFYRWENGKIILTPAQISRKVYKKGVSDFLGDYKKCTKEDKLCPACSLFGIVSENNLARSSRVRFSDAKAIEYTLTQEYIPLKILSSPKTTSYDFYATKEYDEDGAQLRGRKFYLHNPKAKDSDESYRKKTENGGKDKSQQERSDLNASMQLMKKGTFRFNVYFDGISEKELKNLVLSLNLGENKENGDLMHKLGHGKPLGLGSVKILVNGVKFRTLNENSYKFEESEDFNAFLDSLNRVNPIAIKVGKAEKVEGVETDYIVANVDTLKDLLNICNFHLCERYEISYPIIKGSGKPNESANDTASHRFFVWMRDALTIGKNRGVATRSELGRQYKALPTVSEKADNMKLPILKVSGKGVIALDDALNANSNGNNFDNIQNRYGDQRTDRRNPNSSNDRVERVCLICGNKFFTKYTGNNPKCRNCFNK